MQGNNEASSEIKGLTTWLSVAGVILLFILPPVGGAIILGAVVINCFARTTEPIEVEIMKDAEENGWTVGNMILLALFCLLIAGFGGLAILGTVAGVGAM